MFFMQQTHIKRSNETCCGEWSSRFNKGDDSFFKMKVTPFINGHYRFNTSSRTDRESSITGMTVTIKTHECTY